MVKVYCEYCCSHWTWRPSVACDCAVSEEESVSKNTRSPTLHLELLRTAGGRRAEARLQILLLIGAAAGYERRRDDGCRKDSSTGQAERHRRKLPNQDASQMQ